jgi:hypothetical protein
MRRKLRTLTALALVALISAGCGSNAPSETGTHNRSGTADSTGTDKTATDQDKAVKFAECIRNNGISDFPDPNAKGEFEYGVSVTPAVFNEALAKCKDLQPPGSLSSKRTPTQQSTALRFAQCVRENGVKDFPDPANGEPLINTYEIPSSNEAGGMDILNAATAKCQDLLSKAAAGQ